VGEVCRLHHEADSRYPPSAGSVGLSAGAPVADGGPYRVGVASHDEIRAAAERVAPHVRTTPVIAVERAAFGFPVTLKLECFQHSGSFKARGAFNRLLSTPVPASGVVAASGGNHGLAVAYAARELGVRAEIFVPEIASPVKVERLRRYGAIVTQTGSRYSEALEASTVRAAETGALVAHAYDQPAVQAGQGTLAYELDQQCPDLDTVIVAVGGGGLLAGIASWFAASSVRVVAVEPDRIPTLAAALAAGHPVDVDVSGVAADSLGATRISAAALDIARRTDVRSVLVSDDAIRNARRRLWDEARIAVEAGGAAALAAITSTAYVPEPGERIAVIVCGANTDPSDL
jgi:threonine dehydratase